MFVLTDINSGGIYAVNSKDKIKNQDLTGWEVV